MSNDWWLVGLTLTKIEIFLANYREKVGVNQGFNPQDMNVGRRIYLTYARNNELTRKIVQDNQLMNNTLETHNLCSNYNQRLRLVTLASCDRAILPSFIVDS